MKVVYLVRYFTIGGLERVVINLANNLVEKGVNVVIAVMEKGKRNSLITELDDRVTVIFLEGTILRKMLVLNSISDAGRAPR